MNKKIKTLIMYETGIHYIIIINEKKSSLLMNKTTYNRKKLHTISIYKSRNCNLKLKSSFTKVKRIIPQKNQVQYRHKKRCTNCQDHEKMESLSKKKLKKQLQRTRQTERNNQKKVELLA